ncbi:MAG TPA: hypothetical protein PLU16_15300 [Gallionellaceae bacterium]|jgi:hypothetical protein|nr:hypothetical protein [Gallionellaceae bacterium]HQS76570.1 hypothetical protein [Gallionellaceae bacterium]
MNPLKISRYLLLMLFVLLQCVAPLVHAHVHGENVGQNVHFDTIDTSWLSDHHHEPGTTQLSAEEHHHAVVTMPLGYRLSALVIDQPVVASQYDMPVLSEHGAVLSVVSYQQIFPYTPHQHPFSQAPPL